jgi:TonB dependent receptor/CarboxypepD_reg-like domain/TonB-dependent Receptor Plug Domain
LIGWFFETQRNKAIKVFTIQTQKLRYNAILVFAFFLFYNQSSVLAIFNVILRHIIFIITPYYMKKSIPILLATWLFGLLGANAVFAQNTTQNATDNTQKVKNYTISGYITDAKTGETLIGADVYVPKSKQGIATNNYGYYSLTLPAEDSVYLSISYIGYESKWFNVKLDKDIVQNFQLGEGAVLQTVEITATKNSERIDERTQMSVREVPIGQIKQIPALLGEVDVLKALQLLPGVSGGGEGGSGLYVRGGSPDQNLILLDGVPVYNVSHLFGFFSVFNSDAIKNVKLTTGGFPARYGGRLSSVLEINMKEGDMNEWHGEGAVGIIASRLTVEGPIKKGKTSVMLSGRRTYIDALVAPIVALQTQGKAAAGYFFYDFNAKINHKFSDKDRLYFSAYTGQDKLYVNNASEYRGTTDKFESGLNWGNLTSALRWNHVINSKLFCNTTATFSNYEFNIPLEQSSTKDGKTSGFAARYFSGITDWAGKADFDYNPHPDHYIKFGGGFIAHNFRPGAINVKVTNNNTNLQDTTLGAITTNALEFAMYAEDDYQITKKLKANVGLHLSGFGVNNAFYPSVQPRLSLNYALPNATAVKASFATMTQFIHLLTNEGIGLPTDLWVPSTDRIKPENSWQAALGAAKSLGKNKDYELTAEVYYKQMNNVLSYQEGASFLNNANWQDIVTQGVGTSYGLELMLQKKTGRTTGWIGYTLSKTDRQFADINFGKPYPYKYDRRHDVEVVVSHKFTKRFSLSATWVYGTGNATSLPLAQFNTLQENINNYYSGGGNASYYGEKNSYRLPAYHRLDVSMEFHKKYKKWERTWSFGAYNAYNSLNTFFVYRGSNEQTGIPEYKQVTLFPIIPFLNYAFKF